MFVWWKLVRKFTMSANDHWRGQCLKTLSLLLHSAVYFCYSNFTLLKPFFLWGWWVKRMKGRHILLPPREAVRNRLKGRAGRWQREGVILVSLVPLSEWPWASHLSLALVSSPIKGENSTLNSEKAVVSMRVAPSEKRRIKSPHKWETV